MLSGKGKKETDDLVASCSDFHVFVEICLEYTMEPLRQHIQMSKLDRIDEQSKKSFRL